VRQWSGGWPDFHDTEVIGLSLARKDHSVLRVYPYYPHKPATVDFIFENVTDIELQDFSGRNVIMYLRIETATDRMATRCTDYFSARVRDWREEPMQRHFGLSCPAAGARMASANGETVAGRPASFPQPARRVFLRPPLATFAEAGAPGRSGPRLQMVSPGLEPDSLAGKRESRRPIRRKK
jgi:hypothetical protein